MIASRRSSRVFWASLICLLSQAYGLNPNRTMSQYVREQWSSESRFPGGPVAAITQTADGYLWIGSQKGLFRFDGFNFSAISSANPLFKSDRILGLTPDDDGRLCVLFWGSSVLCYRNGEFENLASSASRTAVQVSAMWREDQGRMLLYDGVGGILRVQQKNVEVLAPPTILPSSSLVVSMAETNDGKIWLGAPSQGLYYLSDGRVGHINQLPDKKINCLLPTGDKELWVGTDKGLFRWNGAALSRIELPQSAAGAQTLTLLRDHNDNIWVGTTRGLLRINRNGVTFSDENDFGTGGINALFEDREGNLWAGGARGLERVRDEAFVTYSIDENGRSTVNGPVYAGPGNRIWVGSAAGGLYSVADGRFQSLDSPLLNKEVIYAISGRGEEIWVGTQHDGLLRFRYANGIGNIQTYGQASGLAETTVYSVYQSTDGTVWAGTLTGGAIEFKNGRLTTYTTSNGLLSNTIASISQTHDGTIWFATPKGLSSLSGNRWTNYAAKDGLPADGVNCILETSSGLIWIGSSRGLAFLKAGRVQIPGGVPDPLREEIFGIAEDNNGRLWISSSNHVLSVSQAKLLDGTLTPDDVREYGTADGLRSAKGVKRNRSVVADSDGRIWFSLQDGLSVVDPAHITDSSVPALVHVERVLADNDPIAVGGTVRVPPSCKRIVFEYTGLSLAAPERVRFRYFLDDFDRGWSQPVEAREAVYTNLSPGSYRFHIVASNSDGAWNGTETVLPFQVQPAAWQTLWFRLTCALALALTAWLLYRIRMHQKIAQLNVRFEERLGERTQIAQDLHDTLLQGVLSASMQIHVATNRLTDDSKAKPLLIQVQQLMAQVIDEGRNALQGLRSSSGDPRKFEQAFSRIPEELGDQREVAYRVIVEGSPRPLHPVIRDEVYRIGREAVVNAFRHATAGSIEIQVEYTAAHLRVAVRDDGCGIHPLVLQGGLEGHWGLPGMRERAERIGAKLKLWSRLNAGTKVELLVPHDVAYQQQSGHGRVSWIKRLPWSKE